MDEMTQNPLKKTAVLTVTRLCRSASSKILDLKVEQGQSRASIGIVGNTGKADSNEMIGSSKNLGILTNLSDISNEVMNLPLSHSTVSRIITDGTFAISNQLPKGKKTHFFVSHKKVSIH